MNVRFGPPPIRRPRPRKRLLLALAVIIMALLVIFVFGKQRGTAPAPAEQTNNTSTNKSSGNGVKPETNDEPLLSLTDPKSLWVVVNKKRPLDPPTYVPELADPSVTLNQARGSENMKVAASMAPALEALFEAARKDGVNLALASGYRSYATQERVYAREVKANGQAGADQVSARPGHSEHQTGLGVDVSPANGRCVITECFGSTPEGIWVRDNGWKHGFIIRYPQGKTDVTGYAYEPWHLRYVGNELAKDMADKKVETMEEWFKLNPAPGY